MSAPDEETEHVVFSWMAVVQFARASQLKLHSLNKCKQSHVNNFSFDLTSFDRQQQTVDVCANLCKRSVIVDGEEKGGGMGRADQC